MVHRLTQSEFAVEFQAASASLWCIAAAVLGNRSHAEDVVQEAAIIGLRKLDAFQAGTSFAAWMGQIVRNVARNHGRRRMREPIAATPVLDRRSQLDPSSTHLPVTEQGDLHHDQSEFDDEVLAALQRLGETARACLLLRTVLDHSYQEIADTLDIPPGTAMSHVHRARNELRDRLSPMARMRNTP